MKSCLNPSELRTSPAYSQVVKAGNLIFCAGMVPVDLEGNIVGDDIRTQTKKALDNLQLALQAAGATLGDVCSVTAFLADIERDLQGFNEAYTEVFASDAPARATVSVGLRKISVEIQATAVLT